MHSLKQHKKKQYVKPIKTQHPLVALGPLFFFYRGAGWGGKPSALLLIAPTWALRKIMSRKTAPRIRIGQELEAALKPPGQGGFGFGFFVGNTLRVLNVGFNYHPMKFTHRNSQKKWWFGKCSSLLKWLCLVVVTYLTYFVRFFLTCLRRIHLLSFEIGTLFCTLVLNNITKPDLFLVVQLVTAVIFF